MCDELIHIYRAENLLEAHLLKGMLEQRGIHVYLFGEALTSGVGELPVSVAQIDLHVSRRDAALARRHLEAYEARDIDPGTQYSWCCKGCKELNPDGFEFCWNCRAERCTG